MKTKFIPLGKTLITALALLLLNSCVKKVENTSNTQTGNATVKGKITADLIQTTTKPGNEDVTNHPVYVYVSTKDYAQNPGNGVYPKQKFVGKTDEKGEYSIPIDVSWQSSSTIEIVVPSFVQDSPQEFGAPLRTTFSTSEGKPVVVSDVQDGFVVVKDIVLEYKQ